MWRLRRGTLVYPSAGSEETLRRAVGEESVKTSVAQNVSYTISIGCFFNFFFFFAYFGRGVSYLRTLGQCLMFCTVFYVIFFFLLFKLKVFVSLFANHLLRLLAFPHSFVLLYLVSPNLCLHTSFQSCTSPSMHIVTMQTF